MISEPDTGIPDKETGTDIGRTKSREQARVEVDVVGLANRLRPVILQINRQLRRELHSLGVGSSQVSLLVNIRDNPGIGVGELATLEQLSAPSVCNHIDRLEKATLVTRTRGAGGDGRRVGLQITAEGSRVLRTIRSRRTAWLATRIERLPGSDIRRLDGAVDALAALLDQTAL